MRKNFALLSPDGMKVIGTISFHGHPHQKPDHIPHVEIPTGCKVEIGMKAVDIGRKRFKLSDYLWTKP